MLCQSNWCAPRIALRRALRCATHCGAPRIAVRRALRCAAHCGAPRIAAHRTYMGSCRKKNDWQFSNPRIDTATS